MKGNLRMRDIDEYSNNYLELPFENYQVNYRRKKLLEIIKRYKHKKILEIGCGIRPLFMDIDDFEEMTIVEPSMKFLEHVKINDKKREKINIINGLLEDKVNVLKNRNYDFIVVSNLLHEVEEPKLMMENLLVLCVNNTVVHINVPNAFSLHRLLALEMGIINDVHEKSLLQIHMQQNATFDLKSLTKFVTAAGFDVIEKGSYFPKYFTHKQMQDLLEKNIISEEVIDGMYKMEKYLPNYGSEIYVNIKRSS